MYFSRKRGFTSKEHFEVCTWKKFEVVSPINVWSDFSQLLFKAKSCGQRLKAGFSLNQVDLIFTVLHPACCLSSHGLNVRNWQISNIDGQMVVDSETWNLPKIFKSHKSAKPTRKTGCFMKCPRPPIFTWDLKKKNGTGENCPFDILTHEFFEVLAHGCRTWFRIGNALLQEME